MTEMAEAQDLSESLAALSHDESSNFENDHDDQNLNRSSSTSKNSKKISLQEQFGSLRPFGTDHESKEYRCSSCYRLAIDHCYSNCKHLFCVMCYLRNFQHPCPVCGTILETNTLDQDFEKRSFELKIECEFKKYGCEDLVKLKDFKNHILRCKFSTKNLLPKVYKSNPIAEAIERLTDDVRSIKDALTKVNETMTTLTENVEAQDTNMKKMAEEEHLRNEKIRAIDEANKGMKTEITILNDTVKTIDEGGKKLVESIRDIKDLHAVIFKKLMEDEMQLTRLKEATEESETLRKVEINRLESRLENVKQESEIQMDQTKTKHQSEIKRLETRIQESISQIDKTRTEHQSEIRNLEARIQEIQKLETAHEKQVQELTTKIEVLEYLHRDKKTLLQEVLDRVKASKTPHEIANVNAEAQFTEVDSNLKKLLARYSPDQYANKPESHKKVAAEIFKVVSNAREELKREEVVKAKNQDLKNAYEKMNSWKTPRQAVGKPEDTAKDEIVRDLKILIKKYHPDSFKTLEQKQMADKLFTKIRELQRILDKEKAP